MVECWPRRMRSWFPSLDQKKERRKRGGFKREECKNSCVQDHSDKEKDQKHSLAMVEEKPGSALCSRSK